jgi:hypothetical protein
MGASRRIRRELSARFLGGLRPQSGFMSESSKIGDGGKAAQKARQGRRLAAALRENLKRRKLQVKGRAKEGCKDRSVGRVGAGSDSGPAAPHDSAGFVPDKSKD